MNSESHIDNHVRIAYDANMADLRDSVRKLFTYDPETGLFILSTGVPAFTRLDPNGYTIDTIFGWRLRGHQAAFAWMEGYIPLQVDHENKIRNDNRWVNLIPSNNVLNHQNQRRYSRNTSGVTGVNWHKASGMWNVRITVNTVTHFLGLYADFDGAVAVRREAEERFGFNPRHGGEL